MIYEMKKGVWKTKFDFFLLKKKEKKLCFTLLMKLLISQNYKLMSSKGNIEFATDEVRGPRNNGINQMTQL